MSLTQCNGRRAKLLACDGNEIDTMFVDRRGTAEPQGQKLVRSREPRGSWGRWQWRLWGSQVSSSHKEGQLGIVPVSRPLGVGKPCHSKMEEVGVAIQGPKSNLVIVTA